MPLRAHVAENAAELSDWSERQTRLVKTALHDYQSRTPEGRRKLSWKGVQTDIRDLTGVDMGGKDTLRQLVAGTRDVADPERRYAIVQFLTHPDVDALTMDEFLFPDDPYHAPKRLLEFLNSGIDLSALESPLPCLCGTYHSEWDDDVRRHTFQLHLSTHSDNRVLNVSEVYEKIEVPSSKRTGRRNSETLLTRKESSGWCVLTPEDTVLFFLKENQYRTNHYYRLVSDVDIWTLEPKKSFVLLRYDYPCNTGTTDDGRFMVGFALDALKKEAMVFRKID